MRSSKLFPNDEGADTMKNAVRVGLIGAGRMGQRHCRIFSNLRRARLAGVFDLDQLLGQQVAAQYEAPFYECLDEMLDNVDAVAIATPTPLHFEQAMRCLQGGLHVLVEKPITETIAQAEALVQAAENSGRVIQVGHIERFNPAYIELKNVLEQMRPLVVNFRRLSPFEGSNTDVDVVLDLMIHDTNLVFDLLGATPAAISACGLSAYSNQLDHVSAQMWFEAGPLVSLTASRITEHKIRAIEVTAREGYLECDLLNRSILVHRSTIGEYQNHNQHGFKYRQESVVERIYVPNYESLFLELQHFVECILDNKVPDVSAQDGLDALRWAIRVRAAAQEHLIAAGPATAAVPGWAELAAEAALG
jgi:predicted dehydrogenase